MMATDENPYAAVDAVTARACEVMAWESQKKLVFAGIREVAMGRAVVVSVEKLHEMLDRIETLTPTEIPNG